MSPYTWSTTRDATVRPEHRALEGTLRVYPPALPNCRCTIVPLPGAGRYAAREQARKHAALRAARIARGARRQRATVRVRR